MPSLIAGTCIGSLTTFIMMHGSSDSYAVVDARGVPKIPEGMTFGEIDLIIPAIRKARGFAGEHGGVRYGVPLAGGYELSFRFVTVQVIKKA